MLGVNEEQRAERFLHSAAVPTSTLPCQHYLHCALKTCSGMPFGATTI